jgi:uncharacterized protein YjbI with pentapeptide repeats
MLGWEILQEYKKGRRDFSNTQISIGEFAGADLSGIIFRNCKIEDSTFRTGKLAGADFTGSEIIFTGFTDADLTNAKFNKCLIKWSGFERTIFNNTEMRNSNIVWCSFLDTNIACIDFSNSTQYKNMTDLSQITDETLTEALNEFSMYLSTLDFERRLHMRVIASRTMKHYGLTEHLLPKAEDQAKAGHGNPDHLYAKLISDAIDQSISAYSQKHPYVQKPPYQHKREKKDSYGDK